MFNDNDIYGTPSTDDPIYATAPFIDITISDNTISGGAGNGIFIQASNSGFEDSIGNIISGNTVSGVTGKCINLTWFNTSSIGTTTGNTISNNSLHNCGDDGIQLDASDRNTVVGNVIWNNGGDGIVVNDSDENTIEYNIIFDTKTTPTQDFGIRFASGAKNNHLGVNIFNNNGSGNISDPIKENLEISAVLTGSTRQMFIRGTSTIPIFAINNYTSDVFTVDHNGNTGIGTSTPRSQLHVSSGASGTTTVDWGDPTSTSQVCHNTKNAEGDEISFYFVGTTQVVENNRCAE